MLIVVLGVFMIPYTVLSSEDSTDASSQGIDVSHYQGSIDWVRVKAAGISFAIAKASEGSSYQDPTYQQNCQGMKDNGILTGAYHYLRGDVQATDQVANFLEALRPCTPDAVVVDVEESRNEDINATQMADVLQGMLEGIKASFSNIFVYASPYYWENKVDWRKYDFGKYKLWLAHYTTGSPTVPTTWNESGYTWWQYSNKGSVDGVDVLVDLDRT